ncbi:MAG: ABC transporter permease [Eubacteriales bacterium]|nr:ABC transporter permease [Eubacteriales bacterium]
MDIFLSLPFLQELLLSTLRMATPILIVALAELYSERAGLVNIGLDGIMAFGALAGFLVSYQTGNPYLGILAGALGGILVNLVYAFGTIQLGAQQIVFGMAINIFAPAIASFIYKMAFGSSSSLAQATLMAAIPIPGLSRIPFIGDVFFNHTPIVYLTFLLVPITYVFFAKTIPGLNYKSVGEYPKAAESSGIHVVMVKYKASIICGALAGIGGAYLTTSYISTYSDGVVSGRGFIALTAVIFGRWMPGGILLAALFFGFTDALQLRFQVMNSKTPYQLLAMIPYISTLFALIFFGIKKAGPASSGKPYFREER